MRLVKPAVWPPWPGPFHGSARAPGNHPPWLRRRKALALDPWFPMDRWRVQSLPGGLAAGRKGRWDVLAGSADALSTLLGADTAGGAEHFQVDAAVVVFTGAGHGPLSEELRGRLWSRFHVPVFQEFRARDGRLLARECDAHCGLHIEMETTSFGICPENGELRFTVADAEAHAGRSTSTGLTAEIVRETCCCGLASPRLVELRSLAVREVAEAAGAGV